LYGGGVPGGSNKGIILGFPPIWAIDTKRNDYIALLCSQDDAEKLFQDLAEHLGVEGINRRGVKTDIIHFDAVTLTVLNAIGAALHAMR